MHAMINNFVHVQFRVKDIAKAEAFYSKVFSWKFSHNPEVSEVAYFQVDDSGEFLQGSFYQDDDSVRNSTVLVVNVNNLSETLEKVRLEGGEVVVAPTSTLQYPGYYASFLDNQGTEVGIWSETK